MLTTGELEDICKTLIKNLGMIVQFVFKLEMKMEV